MCCALLDCGTWGAPTPSAQDRSPKRGNKRRSEEKCHSWQFGVINDGKPWKVSCTDQFFQLNNERKDIEWRYRVKVLEDSSTPWNNFENWSQGVRAGSERRVFECSKNSTIPFSCGFVGAF